MKTFSLIVIIISIIPALIVGYKLLIPRRRKTSESSGPTNKRGTWITVIFLLCVLSVFTYIHLTTPEEGINNVTTLHHGSHFLDRVPFIVNVDHDEVATLTKHFWYYDIEYHKDVVFTIIPQGWVGFRYTDENGIYEILRPGRYKIDLDKYEVDMFKIDPQTFKFGN